MTSTIISAWYGAGDETREATNAIQQASKTTDSFMANNSWVGDPAIGKKKYLFIIWNNDGVNYSGIVGENDGSPLIIP